MNSSILRVAAGIALGICAILASASASAQQPQKLSLGVSYTYVRSNVLPGCNCFSLNGGGGEVQYGLARHIAVLGEAAVVHKGGITPDGYSLTQFSYLAGARAFPNHVTAKLQPFAEIAVGGAHASGTLSPSQTGLGGSNAFALQAGGGLEWHLGHSLTVVPLHVDYLLTTFQNGSQNRQNDLEVAAGLKFKISRAK